MKVYYLVADARFFDETAAKEQGLSIEEYNRKIVENLNSLISEEKFAHFIFLGTITKGNFEDTKKLFSQINGAKSLIDYNYNQTFFTQEQWKEIGFNFVWTNSCAEKTTINGKETYVVIEIEKENLERALKLGHYVAIAASLINYKELYKNHLLNISIGNWGLMPLELKEELPRIFDDQELFLTMEDG